MLLAGDSISGRTLFVPPPPREVSPWQAAIPEAKAPPHHGTPEPSYHPQVSPPDRVAAPTCNATSQPYGPGEFSSYVEGQQARELDVDFMRMSFATYKSGPQDICGWQEVKQPDLLAKGWDPAVRLDVPDSQFSAKVFTDGQGNYVLAYRGTQEGMQDWMTNFEQGVGLQAKSGEFELLAPQVAQEFKHTFGKLDANGKPTNLVITGHSQGGGLATVGSLVTGIPAVTFDPSGVHPDTLDRLGMDIASARQVAEGGQIRRYNTFEDALTQAQESVPGVSLLAPDALGHQIVVKPEGDLDAGMVDRALARPDTPSWLTPERANLPGVRNLVRAAISHDQQLMIDTMQQQQPWQPGYRNPTTLNREINKLLPDGVKDDYARNVHDLVTDVQGVVANEFADGDYFEGAFNILGDVGEGFFNSVGDTIDGYADAGANLLRDRVSSVAGDLRGLGLDRIADVAGDVARTTLESAGDKIDAKADAAAATVRDGSAGLGNEIRELGLGRFGDGAAAVTEGAGSLASGAIDGVGDLAEAGSDLLGRGIDSIADFGGDLSQGAANLAATAIHGAGNVVSGAIDGAGDVIEGATDLLGNGVEAAGDVMGDAAQGVADAASWVSSKMPWN